MERSFFRALKVNGPEIQDDNSWQGASPGHFVKSLLFEEQMLPVQNLSLTKDERLCILSTSEQIEKFLGHSSEPTLS